MSNLASIDTIKKAKSILDGVVIESPLQENARLSEKYQARVLLKREDLQQVRSFKIRGAYNKISSLGDNRSQGIVCASAGNHAQGVALSCKQLGIKGTIFMPIPTPKQKVAQVTMFGGDFTEVVLVGDTYDGAYEAAIKFSESKNKIFVHPFDDPKVIEGQATLALEILEQTNSPIDYIFVPIGGGGLISGVITVFKQLSPNTKIIGVEPSGAPSMKSSLEKGVNSTLDSIDNFVDGAAVKRVGEISFSYCKKHLDDIVLVDEGAICQSILEMYNKDAIVVEPAGAMSTASLDQYADKIKGKTVVCLVCGSNNDITRMAEIKERALLSAQLKHYFIVRFPQRAGALKEFVAEILGETDDITYFQFSKKNSKENAPAVVGVELKDKKDLAPLIERMNAHNFFGDYLNDKPDLFQFLI
ncbi:MAG: threonine ammonia-lyase IlvA [Flavobacteriaceae bacterium]|nr:threonine ammonia-lyase IlvA [Flavobacteriaceae bacterium]MDG2315092.1 threonine ammonia-lyase IlvA [Flavobacteriaceae bacterium]